MARVVIKRPVLVLLSENAALRKGGAVQRRLIAHRVTGVGVHTVPAAEKNSRRSACMVSVVVSQVLLAKAANLEIAALAMAIAEAQVHIATLTKGASASSGPVNRKTAIWNHH
jgi:hypothetical protein